MNTSTRNHAVALLSKRLWIYTTSCDTTLNPFSSRRLASCRARLRAAKHTDRLGQCHPGRVNSVRRGATASGRSSAERPGPRLLPCQVQGERESLRSQLPAEGWGRGVPRGGNAHLSGKRATTPP